MRLTLVVCSGAVAIGPPLAACARPAPAAASSGAATAASTGGEQPLDPPAAWRRCASDEDCVAVDRVGCCRNGWKTAVAASSEQAYARSFTCPEAHPMCAMYLVRDARLARCVAETHLCTMVAPEADASRP